MDASIDPRVESNTDSKTKKERINVRADYNGKEKNYMRVFASMPSLSPTDQRTFWVIGHDKNTGVSVVEGNLIVTKDPNYVSANIPTDDVRPWVGKILYIVPNGIQSTADAYASFIVPKPKNGDVPVAASTAANAATNAAPVPPKPTIIPPTVEISDTGYKAMELNKQSNMLNDIQQIVRNELLADRMLDSSVKNTSNKPRPACKQKSCDSYDNSCDNSYDESCTDASDDSSPKIDMSQYIKKDEIPCWGCSIDY